MRDQANAMFAEECGEGIENPSQNNGTREGVAANVATVLNAEDKRTETATCWRGCRPWELQRCERVCEFDEDGPGAYPCGLESIQGIQTWLRFVYLLRVGSWQGTCLTLVLL